MKLNNSGPMKWVIIIILVISALSFAWIYLFGSYSAESQFARALPLSVVIGLTAIAILINEKN